jgi:hypothetical protein
MCVLGIEFAYVFIIFLIKFWIVPSVFFNVYFIKLLLDLMNS